MVPARWESSLLPSISRLLRTYFLLTVAWCLAATMSVANADVPTELVWPDRPQLAGEPASPHFLLIKQEKAGSTRYPLVVRDLRTWSTPDGTRLVLDLNHKASFTESHLRNPDRAVIEVTNAILGKSSRQRVSGGTIPPSFQIAQSRPRVVTITLPRTQGLKYKAFALTNPDRLVIDLYHKAKDQIRQIGDTSSTSPSALPWHCRHPQPSRVLRSQSRSGRPYQNRQTRHRRSSSIQGTAAKIPAPSGNMARRKRT